MNVLFTAHHLGKEREKKVSGGVLLIVIPYQKYAQKEGKGSFYKKYLNSSSGGFHSARG